MNRGAVQALVVILQDQLPVGPYFVVDSPDRPQLRQVVAREPVHQRRERLGQRLRVAREVHKQEPLPLGQRHAVQRVFLLVEARHLIHVWRADETAVERVGPRVIGTLNGLGEPALPPPPPPPPPPPTPIIEDAPLP